MAEEYLNIFTVSNYQKSNQYKIKYVITVPEISTVKGTLMVIKHVDESNVGTGIVDVNGNVGQVVPASAVYLKKDISFTAGGITDTLAFMPPKTLAKYAIVFIPHEMILSGSNYIKTGIFYDYNLTIEYI